MLNPAGWRVVKWPMEQMPLLVVVVDAEAEFNWTGTDRRALGVRSARSIEKAQRILERYRVRPTYVLDYPVSSNPEGFIPVR